MLDTTTNAVIIFNPAIVTNPRILTLIELSATQKPFDDKYYHQIEIMDEHRLLTSEICGQVPVSHSEITDKSNYTLVYADGQLIEVYDLTREEIVFRNYSERFIEMYCQIPKLNPKIEPPATKSKITIGFLAQIVTALSTDKDPAYCLTDREFFSKDIDTGGLPHYESRYELAQEIEYPDRRIPVYDHWVLTSIHENRLDVIKVKKDICTLLVLLDRHNVRFNYIR
jgi:hypothetical protein